MWNSILHGSFAMPRNPPLTMNCNPNRINLTDNLDELIFVFTWFTWSYHLCYAIEFTALYSQSYLFGRRLKVKFFIWEQHWKHSISPIFERQLQPILSHCNYSHSNYWKVDLTSLCEMMWYQYVSCFQCFHQLLLILIWFFSWGKECLLWSNFSLFGNATDNYILPICEVLNGYSKEYTVSFEDILTYIVSRKRLLILNFYITNSLAAARFFVHKNTGMPMTSSWGEN